MVGDEMLWGWLDSMINGSSGPFKLSYLFDLVTKNERMMEGIGMRDGPVDVLDDLSKEKHEKLLIFV